MRNCSRLVSLVTAVVAFATAIAGVRQEEGVIETRVESKKISAPVHYEFNRSVGQGRLVKAQTGRDGFVKRIYKIIRENGKPVGKELIKEERSEAKPHVFHIGKAGYKSSRSAYSRTKVMTMNATAYDPSPASCGKYAKWGRTKMGIKAGYGVCAVDPRVIPLGTMLYVEGYGLAYACDIGSAIKGNDIDLCFPTRGQVNAFGRRWVKVHVLSGR